MDIKYIDCMGLQRPDNYVDLPKLGTCDHIYIYSLCKYINVVGDM